MAMINFLVGLEKRTGFLVLDLSITFERVHYFLV